MEPQPDFRDLLRELNAAGVEYLIVGAHVLAAHAFVRATRDLDVWVRPSLENAKRVVSALKSFGAPMTGMGAEDFASGEIFYRIGVEPVQIDVLTSVPGLRFEAAWRAKVSSRYRNHLRKERKKMAGDKKPAIPQRLKKWRSEGTVVELLGKKIWVHDQGPKTDDAVFIVHGYPGSSWDFQGVVARIGDQTRTVVMDMRGFGLSEKPLDGTYQNHYTLMLQADLYEALAHHLGLKTILLVAHDMGQTVGLELMARFEEDRTSFRIRHAILLDGSTLVDMIQPAPFQVAALKKPAVALEEDLAWKDIESMFTGSFSKETQARADYQEIVTCMSHQVDYDHGSRVMGEIVHYLKERKEGFSRWSRTLFEFKRAPMTVIWGVQDPVAVIAMADRIKKERPVTDLYKYPDCAHWPSIEYPDRIGDAIIARLGSL